MPVPPPRLVASNKRQSVSFLLTSDIPDPTPVPAAENVLDIAQILTNLKKQPIRIESSRPLANFQSTVVSSRPPSFATTTRSEFWETVLDRPSHRIISKNRSVHSFQCAECGVPFKQRGALLSHYRGVHRNERPFICDFNLICRARYKYRGGAFFTLFDRVFSFIFWLLIIDLNRHTSTVHLGIKPFDCGKCGLLFSRKSVRDRHLRKKHMSIMRPEK